MVESIDERLRKLGARYPIDETLTFGLDVGIASVGSAAIRHGQNGDLIEFAGSRCFEPPEISKRPTKKDPTTKELKNKTRRDSRLLRRVIRRRARRMADTRALLVETGLLASTDPCAFHNQKGSRTPDPWQARADGLDRKLTDGEFAAALLHIAKHRGFKSNKKSDRSSQAPKDDQRMLKEVDANKELLAQYGTVGRMVMNDAKFAMRKRNKGGDYTHTFERDDVKSEVKEIFKAQRRLKNAKATAELENRYIGIAFFQRPLQDSEHLVGPCPFETAEKRSPRHAPSFEKFRFLAKINTVKVRAADGTLRRLTREELSKAVADFGVGSESITWNALAKKIGLPKGSFFDGIDEKKAKADVAASGGCAAGTKTIYDVLGPAGWNAVRDRLETLDRIAAVLSFRDDFESIEKGLAEIDGLDPVFQDALMVGVRRGDFGEFKGAGHISAEAARNILPHLLEGMVYSKACVAAGYDHARTRNAEIDDIRNPVVQRSLREAVKQVETLIHHFGMRPGRIVVELAREVGKSAKERAEITTGLDKRNAEKDRHRQELKEKLDLHREPTEEELRRFELWKEQNYRCVYTDASISPPDILSAATQVDHILPRSRSQDNSYENQVLCFIKANQDKGQRTPWEWKVRDENDHDWWAKFEVRVQALNIKNRKKRNLLMRNFEEREQSFVERNLNDTKYTARALLAMLRRIYADESEPDPASEGYLRQRRRLFARPGAITALLRKAWGLNGIKDRADDRHHALDALICAAARNEWLLNSLTQQYQKVEEENRGKWVPSVPPPWLSFRDDAIRAVESVFVSRSEKRRGRGQGHKDTIYGVAYEDNQKITYERKAVGELTKGDLPRLKDAKDRNWKLAEELAAWLEKGKPADDPPRSPKGDPVRKVLIRRRGVDAAGFSLNGGHVDNAAIVRVDVFAKDGKFYLVPIYVHQVANIKRWPIPPDRAITAHKPERDWPIIDGSYEFQFSLYPDSYVEVIRRQGGKSYAGYYRGTDIGSGNIELSPHNLRGDEHKIRGIGARTLLSFRKFHIDRLGEKHEIERETRTWHGAACT